MGFRLIFSGFCMGARARGIVAAQSPLALQPTPVPPQRFFRDFTCFITGFAVAVVWIFWILLELFLAATAIRIHYIGSGFTVATPPLQIVLAPVTFGQGGVWDLSSSEHPISSRSLPSSSDALEESHVDTFQVQ